MFYTQRVVDVADGKPKWSGMQNQSDLIEDTPADLKRKREEEQKEEKKKQKQEEEKNGEKDADKENKQK